MRFRSLLVACALPLAATGAVYGCSGDPAPEDLCGWLQNPKGVNCIAAFHEDIADKCGAVDAATVSGTFATRKTLDMCVLTGKGGSVVFDPPIELGAPPTGMPITMKFVNADGSGCGEVAYTSAFSWSLKVEPPPSGTGGSGTGSGTTTGAGGGAQSIKTGYSQGTISVTRNGGDTILVACPAPDLHAADVPVTPESHVFNLNQVLASTEKTGCPQYAEIIPQAVFEIDPGGVLRAGALRLKIQYPPQGMEATGTGGAGGATSSTSTGGAAVTFEPDVTYYFDCAIPAAPLVCANGLKDASEVDVDCGGPESTPGCPVRCAEGQQCVDVVNSCDCDPSTLCKVAKDGTKQCTFDMTKPLPPKGLCSQIICANLTKDPSESDIDCGGLCALKCAEGKSCGKNEDCAGNSCTLGKCGPPSCTDKSTNGAESDVDCGGMCPTCADGQKCNGAADCKSQGCLKNICSPCANGNKDGKESDIDCGGATCAGCAEGKICTTNNDCLTKVCVGEKCDGCGNGVKDGKESAVDCGGAECPKCADGQTCTAAADCMSAGCLNGKCSQCADGKQNGSESDIDCGGGTCPKCASGKVCVTVNDCANGTCEGFKCGSCADGLKNGTESDVDCGGACLTKCAESKACTGNGDCVNKVCELPPIPDGGVQGPGVCNTCNDIGQNGTETDVNCGGATCPKCVATFKCKINLDCASGICIGQICQ